MTLAARVALSRRLGAVTQTPSYLRAYFSGDLVPVLADVRHGALSAPHEALVARCEAELTAGTEPDLYALGRELAAPVESQS